MESQHNETICARPLLRVHCNRISPGLDLNLTNVILPSVSQHKEQRKENVWHNILSDNGVSVASRVITALVLDMHRVLSKELSLTILGRQFELMAGT